jgi:hypothetical protein
MSFGVPSQKRISNGWFRSVPGDVLSKRSQRSVRGNRSARHASGADVTRGRSSQPVLDDCLRRFSPWPSSSSPRSGSADRPLRSPGDGTVASHHLPAATTRASASGSAWGVPFTLSFPPPARGTTTRRDARTIDDAVRVPVDAVRSRSQRFRTSANFRRARPLLLPRTSFIVPFPAWPKRCRHLQLTRMS